jgi:hypothetical protein
MNPRTLQLNIPVWEYGQLYTANDCWWFKHGARETLTKIGDLSVTPAISAINIVALTGWRFVNSLKVDENRFVYFFERMNTDAV